MAQNTDLEHVSSVMDYKAHEATYNGFLRLSKWAIGILALVLIVLYFIVKP